MSKVNVVEPIGYFVLACLLCEPPLPMPFGDAAARGRWATEHTKGTGHDKWHVWEETK